MIRKLYVEKYPSERVALKKCEDVIGSCVDKVIRDAAKLKDDALLEELAKRHVFDLTESKMSERLDCCIQGCEETFYLDGKPILTFGNLQHYVDHNYSTMQNIYKTSIPIVRYTYDTTTRI